MRFVIGRGQACSDSYHTRRSLERTETDANPVRIHEVSWSLGTKQRPTTHIEHREFGEDCTQLFLESVLRELDFAHIEVADATDLEVFVDDLLVRVRITFIDADGWRHTVGVLRCVLDSTMSKKSAAVGTGAIAFRPLVDIFVVRSMKKKKSVLSSQNSNQLDSHGIQDNLQKMQSNGR